MKLVPGPHFGCDCRAECTESPCATRSRPQPGWPRAKEPANAQARNVGDEPVSLDQVVVAVNSRVHALHVRSRVAPMIGFGTVPQ